MRLPISWGAGLSLTGVLATWSPPAYSQELPPALPPSATKPSAPVSVEQLAERLRAMEEANRKLAKELEQTRSEHAAQMKQILDRFGEMSAVRSNASGEVVGLNTGGAGRVDHPQDEAPPAGDPDTPVPDYTEGQFAPFQPAPGHLPAKSTNARLPLNGTFGPGFQFQTEDEEFRFQVHYESQIEARVWSQANQVPANSGIFLPRQRIFFNGNIYKPIEYELAINRGSGGSLNILNAFVNLHFDDRFQVRMGRFFTPLPYDQYAISNYWLPTPERSLFTTNLSLNRQFGIMGWGYLFDKRLDYAAGIFNGSRNSFESLHNGVDFVGYLNARPFQESKSLPFLNYWNIGTSVAYGNQDQAAVPTSFRIGGGSPNSDSPGAGTTPFLILNPNVVERGERLLGSVHSAYFYKGLSLIGEWQYGHGGYASRANPSSVQVPFSGYYVTGSYFLTGEHVEQRSRLKPLRPLITKKGERMGPGAWEVVGGVSDLGLGEKVFTAGFADPSRWSNSAITTELGMNWYWNEYIKIYMFWLHGHFGDPVMYRPGGYQTTADMLWLRFQLYF